MRPRPTMPMLVIAHPSTRARRATPSIAMASGVRSALFRHLAGIAEHEQSPLVVVHENVAAGVDRQFLAPIDRRRMRAFLFRRAGPFGRHEITDLPGEARIADVEDAQA